jgi:predicted phage terminase large subunit-like protein
MSKKLSLKEAARKGRDDLYYLTKYILGYDKLKPNPHCELTEFMNNSGKRTKLILMPRGSFKSTIISVGYTIQSLIRDPNKTVLVSSETQSNAGNWISEIRSHFEGNERFKRLYGDWSNKGNIWKANALVIKPRNKPKKEASITAGSLEKGTQVGQHYDLIILDDVVSMNNINSDEAIQKTIDHYKLLLSILNPGGEIVVVGTRWGFHELYAWLQDPEGPEFDQVGTFHRAAEDDDGKLLMPEVLNREFLEQQRKTQGSYIYSCQYLNKPEQSSLNVFRKDQVQFYEKSPKGLIYFLTVDPAVSMVANSDYTGIIVNGVDYYGNWFIQEAINEKLEPSALIHRIFGLVQQYQPLMCVAMEKFALEKMLKVNLLAEMEKTGIVFAIQDLETNTRINKQARIRALQPMFENRKVFLKKEHTELFRQVVYFPQLKHDDVLDALKSQLPIVFPSDVKPDDEEMVEKLTINEQRMWDNLDKEFPKTKKRKVKQYYQY